MPTVYCLKNNSAGSICFLKWNKRNAPIVEKDDHTQPAIQDITELSSKLGACHLSPYKEAILGYIAGFIVCKIAPKIHCPQCARALVIDSDDKARVHDHHCSNVYTSSSSLSLILSKNHGGLILPSASVITVIFAAEQTFRIAAPKAQSNKKSVSSKKNLKEQ